MPKKKTSDGPGFFKRILTSVHNATVAHSWYSWSRRAKEQITNADDYRGSIVITSRGEFRAVRDKLTPGTYNWLVADAGARYAPVFNMHGAGGFFAGLFKFLFSWGVFNMAVQETLIPLLAGSAMFQFLGIPTAICLLFLLPWAIRRYFTLDPRNSAQAVALQSSANSKTTEVSKKLAKLLYQFDANGGKLGGGRELDRLRTRVEAAEDGIRMTGTRMDDGDRDLQDSIFALERQLRDEYLEQIRILRDHVDSKTKLDPWSDEDFMNSVK